jgi:hypothetical protein
MKCVDCPEFEKSALLHYGFCKEAATIEQKSYFLFDEQPCWKGLRSPSENPIQLSCMVES